ncbi:UNVERIFIED_CONTAM: blue light receptor [Siphonaria sp. JEL0065]|nr:blue light receptor [Siphonaria sp. JEL0065]
MPNNPLHLSRSLHSSSSSLAPVPPAYASNPSISGSAAPASSTGATPKDKDKDQENSRHVAAVLAQFTGSAEAYGRLVQEKVDLLIVAETALNNANVNELQIAYIAPSCMRIIRCTPASLHHKKIASILHPDDTSLVIAVIGASKVEKQKKSVYCRATRMDRVGEYVLMDLSVEWIGPTGVDPSVAELTHALLIGRVYHPTPIDTIHTLRIQNLQLKHSLAEAVKKRVQSAASHAPTLEMGRTLAEKSAAAVALLRELDNNAWDPNNFSITGDLTESVEEKRRGKRRLEDPGDDLDQELSSILGINTQMGGNVGGPSSSNSLNFGTNGGQLTGDGSVGYGLGSFGAFPSSSIDQVPAQFQTIAQPMSTFDGGISAVATPAAPAAATSSKAITKKPSKRVKIPQDELYCRQCGSTTSPEWRKGPLGPKTLCNACGLAYSKMQSKQRKLAAKEKEKEMEQSVVVKEAGSVSVGSNDSGSAFPSGGFLAGLEAFEQQFGGGGNGSRSGLH